jgi:hypothetical protein
MRGLSLPLGSTVPQDGFVRHTQCWDRSPGFLQTVRVFAFLEAHPTQWVTAAHVAVAVDLAVRTAQAHLLQLVRQRLVDRVKLLPVYQYRLADHYEQRNLTYFAELRAGEADLEAIREEAAEKGISIPADPWTFVMPEHSR